MTHIPLKECASDVELITIYECLCDRTRLRILNLLAQGPLCVCHVQDILGEPQAKISKHLAYLKKHGLVTAAWQGNWRIYALISPPPAALRANLACLQDCSTEDGIFHEDREKLARVSPCLPGDSDSPARPPTGACCPPGSEPAPFHSP